MTFRYLTAVLCFAAVQSAWCEQLLIVADEQKPMNALAEFLRSDAGDDVQIVDQPDLPDPLDPFDAVFMYIHGTMTPETEIALIGYTQRGGRLIVLHHGIASGRLKNPRWLNFTGIHLSPRDHPKTPWRVIGNTTHTVVNLNPSHYITSNKMTYPGIVHYRSTDTLSVPGEFFAFNMENTEVFLNQQFTDGREKTVLFGFLCTDPETGIIIMQDRSGWLKPSGRGWLFYLQPGHSVSDFKNRFFLQIIRNCLTWKP